MGVLQRAVWTIMSTPEPDRTMLIECMQRMIENDNTRRKASKMYESGVETVTAVCMSYEEA